MESSDAFLIATFFSVLLIVFFYARISLRK
jgi:hypothetical protein